MLTRFSALNFVVSSLNIFRKLLGKIPWLKVISIRSCFVANGLIPWLKVISIRSCFVANGLLVISWVLSEELLICLLNFPYCSLAIKRFFYLLLFFILIFLCQTAFPDKVAILWNGLACQILCMLFLGKK